VKIGIIGCGVIGSGLARHFAKTNQVILCDRNDEKSASLAKEIGAQACDHLKLIEQSEMVILAFKPKDLTQFAHETAKTFTSQHILVSVLAGTSVTLLRQLFPLPVIIRAMPNLPLICGESIIGFVTTPEATAEGKKKIEKVFNGLGLLCWVSEDHLEGLSALTGSGPAFIFVLIEAMIDSGVFLGFTQQEARDFVLKTIEGSVALLKATGLSPADLKRKVAPPGGTTVTGLKVLEDRGIRGILLDTFRATFQRARELHQ
jgi:pyrroline-5-carboxylate reductase